MPITDSLISWWALDEESGTRVDSHGSNNLADNNSVLYAAGKQGNAADFEVDTLEWLSIADNASLSFGDEDFTVATWVKLETIGANRVILSKWNYGANTREYQLRYVHADLRFDWRVSDDGTNEAAVQADELGEPAAGTWYFVVCWHDSTSNVIGIQVNNGTADTTAHTTGCNDNTSPFLLGANRNDDTTTPSMDGLMDEVPVWNRLLTTFEKTDLYNAGAGRSYVYLSFVPTATTIF